jgi:peroxiredoxin
VLIGEDGKVVKAWDRVNPRSFATEALSELPQSVR